MKRILYLGLEKPSQKVDEQITHFPVIEIVPLPREEESIAQAFAEFPLFTHIIFTSKSSVEIFFDYAKYFNIDAKVIASKCFMAVGKKTADKINSYGIKVSLIAEIETSEGLVQELSKINLANAFLFWPHSAHSRPVLQDWLQTQNIKFNACIFYHTIQKTFQELPNLEEYDEIFFSSPSTVDAFLSIFKKFPINKKITSIGPVTQKYLSQMTKFS